MPASHARGPGFESLGGPNILWLRGVCSCAASAGELQLSSSSQVFLERGQKSMVGMCSYGDMTSFD